MMAVRSSIVSFLLFSVGLCAGKKGRTAFRQGVEVTTTAEGCTTWPTPTATTTTVEDYKSTDLKKSEFGLCSSESSVTQPDRPDAVLPSTVAEAATICGSAQSTTPCCGLGNKCVNINKLKDEKARFEELVTTKPDELIQKQKDAADKVDADNAQAESDAETVCCEHSKWTGGANNDQGGCEGELTYTYSYSPRAACTSKNSGNCRGNTISSNSTKCGPPPPPPVLPPPPVCGVVDEAAACGLDGLKNCEDSAILPNGWGTKTPKDFYKNVAACYISMDYVSGCGSGFTNDEGEGFFSLEQQYFAKLDFESGAVTKATLCAAVGSMTDTRSGMVDKAMDNGKVIRDFIGMQVIGGLSKNRGLDFLIVEDEVFDAHKDKDTVKEIFFSAGTGFKLEVGLTLNAEYTVGREGKKKGNPRSECVNGVCPNSWPITGSSPIWIPNLE